MSDPFGEPVGDTYVGGGGLPPIDVTEYADLRLFDRTDNDMVQTAVAAGQLAMPGWNPNEGNIEVLLIELLSLVTAEQVVAINRLPGAVVETIISMVGVTRDYGAAPTAQVRIEFSDPLGHTVPAGTRFYLITDNGDVVTFLLEFPGASAEYGADVGFGSVIGGEFTSLANGMLPGTELTTTDSLPFIDRIALTTPVVDGDDPETDQEWRSRGISRLQALSSVLVSPQQFEAAARGYADVARAVGIDLYDPAAHAIGGRVNLLPDASFEAGTSAIASVTARTGATVTAVARSTSVPAADGTQYAFANITGDANSATDRQDAVFRTVLVPVIGGKVYRAQFDAYPNGGVVARVGVEWLNASSVQLTDTPSTNGGYVALSSAPGAWRTLGLFAQAPAGATQARMTMAYGNAPATPATVGRVDRLLFEDAATYLGTWFANRASAPDVAGTDPGHMTIAVLSEGGYLLSDERKAVIQNELTQRAVAMLAVHVVNVGLVTVDVVASFAPMAGYDGPSVVEDVRAALRRYLDPERWFWGSVVRHNELVALIDRVEGVDWVGTVTVPGATNGGAGDLTMNAPTALPHYGALTVTADAT